MKKLKQIRKQEAFKLPKNYFENFEAEMMNKLPQTERQPSVNWFELLIYRLQLRFVLPSLLLGILIAAIIYIDLERENKAFYMSDTEIADYLLEEYDDELDQDIYAMSLELSTLGEEQELTLRDAEIIEYLAEDEVEAEVLEMLP